MLPFILFGAGALYIAAIEATAALKLEATGKQVPGVIESNDWSSSSKGGSYHARYTYDFEGKHYSVRSSIGSNPAAFNEGEHVTVFVDPTNPAKGRIKSFLEMWMLPLVLGIFGVAFGGAGIGVSVLLYKEDARIRKLKENGIRLLGKVVYKSFKETMQHSVQIAAAKSPGATSSLAAKILEMIPDEQVPTLVAHHPSTGEELEFSFSAGNSRQSSFRPVVGGEMYVYVDAQNVMNYYIAIDEGVGLGVSQTVDQTRMSA
jgi:hypothetical protein